MKSKALESVTEKMRFVNLSYSILLIYPMTDNFYFNLYEGVSHITKSVEIF